LFESSVKMEWNHIQKALSCVYPFVAFLNGNFPGQSTGLESALQKRLG